MYINQSQKKKNTITKEKIFLFKKGEEMIKWKSGED